jgi:FkbM family methyltransferase
MNVEVANISLLPYFLNLVDAQKNGLALDVGVGTSNFYCAEFSKLGYESIAVEPLPCADLKKLCLDNGINLVNAVLGEIDGAVNIYSGIYKDEELSDVSSTNPNWWGVSEKSKEISVESIRLDTLTRKHNITKISYMKVDTEGSELSILAQVPLLPLSLHPSIIEFEYGGGGSKKDGGGGWNESFFSNTLQILSLLKNIGYHSGLIIEREEPEMKSFKNDLSAENIFKDHYVYGNILLSKANIFETSQVAGYYNASLNEKLSLKEKFFKYFK